MTRDAGKTAVIYCRSASWRQNETKSERLAPQRARCSEYALAKDYRVVRVFEDLGAGRHTDRPGMKALLAFIQRRRAEGVVVVVDDLARIARDVNVLMTLRAAIASAGGTIEGPSVMPAGTDPHESLEEALARNAAHWRLHRRRRVRRLN